eukprot:ctg_4830.g641
MHIRAFNEVGFAQPDWDVPAHVQTAAVMGVGLVYQGSNDRMILDGLLQELSRRYGAGASEVDREAHALAAGMAIGWVGLGAGATRNATVENGRRSRHRLHDALLRLMQGGRHGAVAAVERAAAAA